MFICTFPVWFVFCSSKRILQILYLNFIQITYSGSPLHQAVSLKFNGTELHPFPISSPGGVDFSAPLPGRGRISLCRKHQQRAATSSVLPIPPLDFISKVTQLLTPASISLLDKASPLCEAHCPLPEDRCLRDAALYSHRVK